jgi:ArsR family transcriptional regulator
MTPLSVGGLRTPSGTKVWAPVVRTLYSSNMVESIALEMRPPGEDGEVALLLAVADPIRWAVLEALSAGQRCVCDLQERVPVPSNLLSYHLKVLREAGLVTSTRRGRWIDYALAEDAHERMRHALPGARAAALT